MLLNAHAHWCPAIYTPWPTRPVRSRLTLSALSSSSAVMSTCRSSFSEGSGLASFLLRPSFTLPRPRMAILQLVSCRDHVQTQTSGTGSVHNQLLFSPCSTTALALHVSKYLLLNKRSTAMPHTSCPARHSRGPVSSPLLRASPSVPTSSHPLHAFLCVAAWADDEPDEVVARVLLQRYAQLPVLLLRPVVCWGLEGGAGFDQLRDQLLGTQRVECGK